MLWKHREEACEVEGLSDVDSSVCSALLRHPGNGVLAVSYCGWYFGALVTRGSRFLCRWLLFTFLEHMLTLIPFLLLKE